MGNTPDGRPAVTRRRRFPRARPERERRRTLNESTEGHHAPDPLSNRKAGALLLAFLAAVVVVLAVATIR